MQQAMLSRGPDGSGSWCKGPIGMGHLMLYNTPQSVNETLPLHSEDEKFAITAKAWLDNREDLIQALHIAPSEQNLITDSLLILKAYQKWGTECTKHLLGDWCFAIWDAEKRKLFVARDHFGVTSLYYTQVDNSFIFASSLKGILSHPMVTPRLNMRDIACFAPGYFHDTETSYKNIFRLPPAHTLTITKIKTQLHRYWYMEDAPEIRYRSDQEYIDHFLDIYQKAVDCRLRSFRPVGTQISGGLDSSSMAILAAQKLKTINKRLPAFCSIPLHDTSGVDPRGRFGNEGPHVKNIAKLSGNIDINLIKSENISPLQGIKHLINIMDQPIGSGVNAHWQIAILEAAQQQGIGTLLSGWGGNYTVSWTGERSKYLRQLVKNGNLRAYLNEINAWRKNNSDTLLHTISSQILKPLIPDDWLGNYRARANKQVSPLNMSLVSTLAANYKRDTVMLNSALYGLNLFSRTGITGSIEEELGAAYGINFRQPTMDKRLIEFCLGIPQNQYTRNGQNKLLIRRAMQGSLPDDVLWGQQRGLQSADMDQRIRCSSAEIEDVLKTLDRSSLARKFLNLEAMTDSYQAIKNTQSHLTPTHNNLLLRGVLLGIFLQRFDDK